MKRRTLCFFGVAVVVLLVVFWVYSSNFAPPPPQMTRDEFIPHWYGLAVDPSTLPVTITDDVLENTHFNMPGLRGMDLSGKDMSEVSLDVLMAQTFDANTKWPSAVPEGFTPGAWTEAAKDPGLGIRHLHAQGLTGAGVTVAVFDNPMDPDHVEYGDRITYHRVAARGTSAKNWRLHPHGHGTTSILAGETIGVAPDATIHYFARSGGFERHLLALRDVMELNKTLPEGERIQIVSISDGFGEHELSLLDDWEEAVGEAAAAGITVFYSDNLGRDGLAWGGCPVGSDRNLPANYQVANPGMLPADRPTLIVPGDYRATASNTGSSDYVYYGLGGWSWGIPYVAGLAALSWQVDPGLTYDQFVELLWETSTVLSDSLQVVSPAALLQAVCERSH